MTISKVNITIARGNNSIFSMLVIIIIIIIIII